MEKNNLVKESKEISSSKEDKLQVKSKYFTYAWVGLVIMLLIFSSVYIYQKYYVNNGNSNIPNIEELKQKAENKYLELRGVSFAEENLVTQNITQAAEFSQPIIALDQAGLATDPDQRNLSQETAKRISQKITQNTNPEVFYYEVEVIANKTPDNNTTFPYYLGQSSLLNYSKPFTLKTWLSACSNKSVMSQDSKVINFSNYTNSSNTNYLGGKYAIKAVYNDADLGYGCFDTGIFNSNSDLEFVKGILSNPENFKQVGTETIKGTKTVIYEQKFSEIMPLVSSVADSKLQKSSISNSKVRFFVDLDKFQVLRTQYFDGDTLIYTQNLLNSKKITSDGQKEIISTEELKGTEIKEVRIDLSKTVYNQETKLKDALKSFAVLYLNNETETVNYMYLYSNEAKDEYSKLTQTNDFDPSWEENQKLINSSYTPSLASYAGNGYSMIVYKNQPIQSKENTVRSKKQITIDGKKIDAELIKFSYDETNKSAPDVSNPTTLIAPSESSTIEFQYQNNWYTLGFYGWRTNTTNPTTDEINLISLTNEKADQIDSRNEFIKNSQPKVSYKSELKDIPEQRRYLPGNLKDNYKLQASFLTIDGTPNSKSTCIDLKKSERIYSFEECLVDNFDGMQLAFSSDQVIIPTAIDLLKDSEGSGSSSSSSGMAVSPVPSSSVNFMVLKGSYADLKPYLIQLNNYEEGVTSDYRELDGYTFVLQASTFSKSDRKSILDGVKLNNGLTELDQQLKQNASVGDRVRGL